MRGMLRRMGYEHNCLERGILSGKTKERSNHQMESTTKWNLPLKGTYHQEQTSRTIRSAAVCIDR